MAVSLLLRPLLMPMTTGGGEGRIYGSKLREDIAERCRDGYGDGGGDGDVRR